MIFFSSNVHFQDDQQSFSFCGAYPQNDKFKVIKGGKKKISSASEFKVKLSNKFDALMEEENGVAKVIISNHLNMINT
jgi:hypothetical protein